MSRTAPGSAARGSWRHSLLLAGAAATALVSGAPAQAPPQPSPAPVFTVGSELVVVDLVPTDREGRFIGDLAGREVLILEDGKPQAVHSLQLVRAPGALEAASPNPAVAVSDGTNAAPRPTSAESPPGAAPDLAILFDLQTLTPEGLTRSREAASRLLGELPRGPRVMVATLLGGVEVREPFTTELDRARAAIEDLRLVAGTDTFSALSERVAQACDGSLPPDAALGLAVSHGKAFLAEARQQLKVTAAALGAISRLLGTAPGRKHLVFYSGGHAVNPAAAVEQIVTAICGAGGAGRAELSGLESPDGHLLVQDVVDQANREEVSIYTVDGGGLATTSLEARQGGAMQLARRGLAQLPRQQEVVGPQEFLRSVAEETGGQAFLNSNDLAGGLRRAWMDATEYYLAAYVPPPPRAPGVFHKIEVRLTRPGARVRFRRGYREATAADLAQRDLARALTMPAVFESRDLEVRAAAEGDKLSVVVQLATRALAFRRVEDRWRCDIDVDAVLRDEAGTLVDRRMLFSRHVEVNVPDERYEAIRETEHLEVPAEVDRPARGIYRLVVVVRHSSRELATRTVPLRID